MPAHVNLTNNAAVRPVCVVTGANSGVGFEITRILAARGVTVVMICRDPEGAAAARARLSAVGSCFPRRHGRPHGPKRKRQLDHLCSGLFFLTFNVQLEDQ